MDAQIEGILRHQLLDRRGRLQDAIPVVAERAPLVRLLEQVDEALARMDQGTYGLCEVCNEAVEGQRLLVDPLLRNCLDHLTAEQQRTLERDLDLARHLQQELLPRRDARLDGWEIDYHYEPVGPVSGDYCDVMQLPDGDTFFALGDVSGKGIAASMLMSHLHAIFRSLGSIELPMDEMISRANRLFCESTTPSFFATLVCGRAGGTGEVQICSAGHPPALWASGGQITRIEAGGLPLGLFCSGDYQVSRIRMEPGDALVLYSDGLSEAAHPRLGEYGLDRLSALVGARYSEAPGALIGACLADLRSFLDGAGRTDDLTILAMRRQYPPVS